MGVERKKKVTKKQIEEGLKMAPQMLDYCFPRYQLIEDNNKEIRASKLVYVSTLDDKRNINVDKEGIEKNSYVVGLKEFNTLPIILTEKFVIDNKVRFGGYLIFNSDGSYGYMPRKDFVKQYKMASDGNILDNTLAEATKMYNEIKDLNDRVENKCKKEVKNGRI